LSLKLHFGDLSLNVLIENLLVLRLPLPLSLEVRELNKPSVLLNRKLKMTLGDVVFLMVALLTFLTMV
jgi:hypothetical protein